MEAKVIPINKWAPGFYNLVDETEEVLLLFGATVRAGFPSPAADYSADPIDLNKYISENPTATFLARVEGEFTIKRYILKKDGAYLQPENPNYKTMKIDTADGGHIWGVVVGVIKKFK